MPGSRAKASPPKRSISLNSSWARVFLPCGTYRPETTFGVTNLWLNPEVKYVRAKVNDEEWIVSEDTIEKLANQKYLVTVHGDHSG